ncbi:efflux RND transporter periplasmic adaptor subunit [Solimonas soli]|uniref:efflux RND transporter periplasmic adaptor subunit n=1 Tax=Solimonas soli TaxID=413479 RepID=UPI000483480F|nr:HlyD family secretion protein [Solimonas soli]
MKPTFKSIGPVLLTLAAAAVAVLILIHLWRYYYDDPWTRDAYVQSDVVQIAPDVSGLITEVRARDNGPVRQGEVLFVVDQARYRLAQDQAEANIREREAAVAQLQREVARNARLGNLVAGESAEESRAKLAQADAALQAARTALDVARLNLERTEVRSPVDGFVNDRTVRVGDYVSTGHAVLSVVDTATLHVDGYFEETKLARIEIGQRAYIRLMGERERLRGHVESIAAGVTERNRSAGSNLLPNIDPAFNWVRLAQRIPVRIAIDAVPRGVRLVTGRSATVTILPDAAADKNAPNAAAKPATSGS